MRSESTSALGQPSETSPTRGGRLRAARWAAAGRTVLDMRGLVALDGAQRKLASQHRYRGPRSGSCPLGKLLAVGGKEEVHAANLFQLPPVEPHRFVPQVANVLLAGEGDDGVAQRAP